MSNGKQVMVVRRACHEENTFAVVQWNGSRREMLLPRIRRAVTEWMEKHAEGAEAWAESSYDFNVADLAEHLCDLNLKRFLEVQGVRDLEIETYSDDSPEEGWSYDAILREDA